MRRDAPRAVCHCEEIVIGHAVRTAWGESPAGIRIVRIFAERRAAGWSLRMTTRNQALKGIWWMPWHQEAMKDVARCDKPRGVASRL